MNVVTRGLVISVVVLVSSCGVKQSGAMLKGDSSRDPLVSIGRGTKLTLLKDLEIPANSEQVTIGPVEYYTPVEGQGNTNRKTYLVCGVSAKEPSLDRRVLNSGSVIELNGVAETYPNGEGKSWNVEAIGISSPSALSSIGCVKLVTACWIGYCDPYSQIKFTVEDLETVLNGLAKVERAEPVVIPSN